MFYESGVAMSLERRTLKAVSRDPERSPVDQVKCQYYHPLYFTRLGHKDCSNDRCHMKTKSKEDRASALKVISADQLGVEVKRNAALVGMYFFERVLICTYIVST